MLALSWGGGVNHEADCNKILISKILIFTNGIMQEENATRNVINLFFMIYKDDLKQDTNKSWEGGQEPRHMLKQLECNLFLS